jgi:CBS-domain-containing membrane protein
MKAREVMTTKVVSVGPDLATRKVAKMLIDNKISAVPVVDDKGSPIGMVSEGDLVSCDQRQYWDDHVARLDGSLRKACTRKMITAARQNHRLSRDRPNLRCRAATVAMDIRPAGAATVRLIALGRLLSFNDLACAA